MHILILAIIQSKVHILLLPPLCDWEHVSPEYGCSALPSLLSRGKWQRPPAQQSACPWHLPVTQSEVRGPLATGPCLSSEGPLDIDSHWVIGYNSESISTRFPVGFGIRLIFFLWPLFYLLCLGKWHLCLDLQAKGALGGWSQKKCTLKWSNILLKDPEEPRCIAGWSKWVKTVAQWVRERVAERPLEMGGSGQKEWQGLVGYRLRRLDCN